MEIYVLLVHFTNHNGDLDPGESTGIVKAYTLDTEASDAYDKLTSLISPGDGVDSYEIRPCILKEHTL